MKIFAIGHVKSWNGSLILEYGIERPNQVMQENSIEFHNLINSDAIALIDKLSYLKGNNTAPALELCEKWGLSWASIKDTLTGIGIMVTNETN